MPGEILAILMVFGIPMVAIITSHQRKVLEMKLRLKQQGDQGTLEAMQELRRQIMEVRDTTTKYDLSFDAALQRLDGRMAAMEQRIGRVESQQQTTGLGAP